MGYRYDADLEFLGKLSAEQLAPLVEAITKDEDGSPRLTEGLTGTTEFKRHAPDHTKYWELIAAEVQTFGANTIATALRGGKGVLYREVLIDHANLKKVNFKEDSKIEVIEDELMRKLAIDAMENMTPEQLMELAKENGVTNYSLLNKEALIAAIMLGFRQGRFKSYQLLLAVANAAARFVIGKGLPLAVNALLVRTASLLTGPLGWAINAGFASAEIASPATRVTKLVCVIIPMLRQEHLSAPTQAPAAAEG